MSEALILFAHGARDPAWAEPIRRVQSAIQAIDPAVRVECAFLEFISPTLDECATRLVADGARRVVVVPMFIAQGGHLKEDVPRILAALRADHPQVEFELAGAVGETEAVILAMASTALAMLNR